MLSSIKQKIGIKSALLTAIAIASFVLSSVAGIWRIYAESEALEASILREGRSVMSLLSHSMSHMAMAYDYTNMEEISAKIVENPSIARVGIFSVKGKPMAAGDDKTTPRKTKTIRETLLFDRTPVGEIEIVLDLDQTTALFQRKVVEILLEQALVTITLVLALNFILSSLIARPILTLTEHLLQSDKRKDSDTLPPLMDEKGLREFSEIANVFNKMVRSIYAYQTRLREKIDTANRGLLEANMRLEARAAELEHKTSDLQNALALVERLATTDPLTEIFNRRAFDQFFEHEISKHQRYKRLATLAVIDLDFFKEVNDNYGHAAGDFVLKEVSQTIRQVLRGSDIFARLGGDEFAIVFPETNIENTKIAIRKIMTAIAQHRFIFDGCALRVGMSIGVAEFGPHFRASRIMSNADAAAYHSKKSGRNRASYCMQEENENIETFFEMPLPPPTMQG